MPGPAARRPARNPYSTGGAAPERNRAAAPQAVSTSTRPGASGCGTTWAAMPGQAGRRQYLRRRSGRDGASTAEQQQPVAPARGQVHVVQDHQHAHALVARQVHRHAQQLALMPGIQTGGRLVQQQVARRPRRAPPGTGSARARTARAAAHRPTVRDNGARADGWRRPAPASCPPAPPRPRAAARERGRRPSPPPRPRPGRSPAPVSAAARRAGAPAARAPCRTDPRRPGATRPRRRATRRPARPAASTCRRRWRPAGPPLRPAPAPATRGPARAPPRDRMRFSAASVIRPSCPAPAATGRRDRRPVP